MNNIYFIFALFVIYPMTVNAQENLDTSLFDELPIEQQEINSVTKLFWNAQSIQDNVKAKLPTTVRNKFTPSGGCDVKAVTKTEADAGTCDLNDDPTKNAKFIYNFNVACTQGATRSLFAPVRSPSF
jgi:hypothetical protein